MLRYYKLWSKRTQEDIDKALNDDEKTSKPESLTMWVDGERQMSFYKEVTKEYTKKQE